MRILFALVAAVWASYALAQSFTHEPAGMLVPGSGSGLVQETIFLEGIRFPIELAPVYANSQVYGVGGLHGPAGGQCDARNYSYPWRDNFCESRPYGNAACPFGKGHQGQDIRPPGCLADAYWAVAAEAGMVAAIGRYSVTIQTPSGRLYRYLHLNMDELAAGIDILAQVARGQRIGLVSNHFDGTPTTIYLHFDVKDTLLINGVPTATYVPPYTSLVNAYERLLAGRP